jgi:hypothetical protein
MKKRWLPVLIALVCIVCFFFLIGSKKPADLEEPVSLPAEEPSSNAEELAETPSAEEEPAEAPAIDQAEPEESQPSSEPPATEEPTLSEPTEIAPFEIPERFTQPDSPYYIPDNVVLHSLSPEIQQCACNHIDWKVSIGVKSPWAYAPDEYNGETGYYGPANLDYISNDWFDFDMSGGYSQNEVDAFHDWVCTDERIAVTLEMLESYGNREVSVKAAEEYIMQSYGSTVYEGSYTFRGTYLAAVG